MAMDPNKLAALVEEQSVNPLGDLPMGDEEATDEEGGGEADAAERGEELLTSMGDFGNELRESADIMLDNAVELGEDATSEEPAPETEELAMDMADRLPTFIQDGMVEHIADKPPEDLTAIGAALESSLETEDGPEGTYTEEVSAQIGGMLGMVAKCCGEEGDDEEEEDEDTEAPADLLGVSLTEGGHTPYPLPRWHNPSTTRCRCRATPAPLKTSIRSKSGSRRTIPTTATLTSMG